MNKAVLYYSRKWKDGGEGNKDKRKVEEERASHIVATLHAGFHYVNETASQCLYPSCDQVLVTHRSWVKIRHRETYLPVRLEAT